ncbi:MAG TPA: hypothetical protein VLM11_20335 [Streptosporangiaceae bacterium]|nr:hypothetical protein [Streptosporangiaceae bacterium]
MTQLAGPNASPRAHKARPPRILIAALAVLLAVGAFLLWGPIGLGNGPLGVASMDGRFGLSTSQPTGFVATLVNTGGSAAVIDDVTVTSAAGYAPVRVLTVRVARNSNYGCVDTLMSSVARCARPPFEAAARFTVVPRANTAPGDRGGPALVIEIASPPTASCAVLTAVVLHYHVGIRHYAATVPQGFVWSCGRGAHLPQN